MSMKLTRREALKGVAAFGAISFLPAGALAAIEDRGNVATTSFDDGWLFLRGDASGAQELAFDASAWRKVDLPHDWSIEDLPAHSATNGSGAIWDDCNCPESIGPFSRMHSEGKGATGWVVGGIGWYRKSFDTPAMAKGGRAILLFDGIYRNSEVWINGKEVGKHVYGYTAFYFDATDFLNEQGTNVIAVKVTNVGKNSRWYSGSGLDRHVVLMTTGRVSIPVWGVHVLPSEISAANATVTITVQLANHDSAATTAKVVCKLIDEKGSVAATLNSEKKLAAKGSAEVVLVQKIAQPVLWSPASPHRYT